MPEPSPLYRLTVKLPGGSVLRYRPDAPPHGAWAADMPEDDDDGAKYAVVREAVGKANEITDGYTYNPGDGYPGYRLTRMVAEAVGGEAVLPPLPPDTPGTVY